MCRNVRLRVYNGSLTDLCMYSNATYTWIMMDDRHPEWGKQLREISGAFRILEKGPRVERRGIYIRSEWGLLLPQQIFQFFE